MISIKYLALLMTGIFLALGLGILIGITLENNNIIESQQIQLIHKIEDHYVTMRTETEQLKLDLKNLDEKNSKLQELSSFMLNELIKDRLRGLNVAIITFSKHAPIMDMVDFLETAGVSVEAAITILYDSYISNNGTIVNALQQPHEIMNFIVEDLIQALVSCNLTSLIHEAAELMMVSHVWNLKEPVDYIVLFKQDAVLVEYDNILIQKAFETDIPVVVVDTNEIDTHTIARLKSMDISTVDHIESIYGKLALASVLSGNQGNFSITSDILDKLPNPIFSDELSIKLNASYSEIEVEE